MNDELEFLDEGAERPGRDIPRPDRPWRILIVDDDEGVHRATRFALERVQVDGRPLAIADAYSAEDARAYLAEHPDVAMALVDVVMETEHAGLDLVRWVREKQNNRAIRLVLRTGQPGQAPERDVVAGFDIDDYKTKSELTSQKLFTLIHASLRSYRHIRALERNLNGLRRIVSAASSLSSAESVSQFATGVLEQLTALLNLAPEAVYCETRGVATRARENLLDIVAATGAFADLVGQEPQTVLPKEVRDLLDVALKSGNSVFGTQAFVSYFESSEGNVAMVYVGTSRDLLDDEIELIELFSRNMNLAFCGLARPVPVARG